MGNPNFRGGPLLRVFPVTAAPCPFSGYGGPVIVFSPHFCADLSVFPFSLFVGGAFHFTTGFTGFNFCFNLVDNISHGCCQRSAHIILSSPLYNGGFFFNPSLGLTPLFFWARAFFTRFYTLLCHINTLVLSSLSLLAQPEIFPSGFYSLTKPFLSSPPVFSPERGYSECSTRGFYGASC